MKKFLFAISALFVVLSLGAQSHKQSEQGKKFKEGVEEFRKEAMERLQSEHVAYLTNELQLTPEEAQAFWPVYNKAQDEQRKNHCELSAAKKALKDAVKEGKGESELKKALTAYNKARTSQRYVIGDYQSQFEKILGVEKTAKLYIAEDSFRTRQIHRLGDSGRGPQRPGVARPQGGSERSKDGSGSSRRQGGSHQRQESQK